MGRSRDSLLYAKLDVGGGRLGLRLDLDQVVDEAHARELTNCALGGVSLRCRLGLSMKDDASVTDLRRDRVRNFCSPASEMRDLLGDLVVGALVERRLSDFDVIGDGPHCLDALGCSHGHMLLVDRHDVAGERDRPIDRGHPDVLRDYLRVVFELLDHGVPKGFVADDRLTPVFISVIVTLAPETTAPLASVTVPRSVAFIA